MFRVAILVAVQNNFLCRDQRDEKETLEGEKKIPFVL